MIRISLYFSLVLAFILLSACKKEVSFDEQLIQFRQTQQDLLFEMHIFKIDPEAREMKVVLRDSAIPGNVTVSLSW